MEPNINDQLKEIKDTLDAFIESQEYKRKYSIGGMADCLIVGWCVGAGLGLIFKIINGIP